MKDKKRFLILNIIIIVVGIFIIVNIQKKQFIYNKICSGDLIDMTKMLQYGEKVSNIEFKDKYGNIFDLEKFKNEPLLLFFIKDNLRNIQIFNDSLDKYIGEYSRKGLKYIFINTDRNNNADSANQTRLNVYYDTDSLSLCKLFKVYNHGSNIILNKDHKVILSTIKVLFPEELLKIIKYKEKDIF
jgi:cytochrome oxidase Cu insertion factor (SCO1/SenC/PrrC family)